MAIISSSDRELQSLIERLTEPQPEQENNLLLDSLFNELDLPPLSMELIQEVVGLENQVNQKNSPQTVTATATSTLETMNSSGGGTECAPQPAVTQSPPAVTPVTSTPQVVSDNGFHPCCCQSCSSPVAKTPQPAYFTDGSMNNNNYYYQNNGNPFEMSIYGQQTQMPGFNSAFPNRNYSAGQMSSGSNGRVLLQDSFLAPQLFSPMSSKEMDGCWNDPSQNSGTNMYAHLTSVPFNPHYYQTDGQQQQQQSAGLSFYDRQNMLKWLKSVQDAGFEAGSSHNSSTCIYDGSDAFSSVSAQANRNGLYHRSRTPPFLVGQGYRYEVVCPNGCSPGNVKLPCKLEEELAQGRVIQSAGNINCKPFFGNEFAVKVEPEDLPFCAQPAVVNQQPQRQQQQQATKRKHCQAFPVGPPRPGCHAMPIHSWPMERPSLPNNKASPNAAPAAHPSAAASRSSGHSETHYSRPRAFDLEQLAIGNFVVENRPNNPEVYATKVKVVPAKKRILYEFTVVETLNPQNDHQEVRKQTRSYALVVPFAIISGLNSDSNCRSVFMTVSHAPQLYSSDGPQRNAISFDKTCSVDPSAGEFYFNRLHRILLKGPNQVDRFVNSIIEFNPPIKHMIQVVFNTSVCSNRTTERLPDLPEA